MLRAVAAGMTDVGLQREHNEDSFAVLSQFGLFIVADGMGGHKAGDVASRLATDAIADFFRSTAHEDVTWPFHFDTNLSEEENRLVTGIRIANRQIFERSRRSRDCQGMGTTVVGALFSAKKKRIHVGHVGDSRAYRIRDGVITQLTRDHSLVNDYMLAMPDLTEEQAAELPKNVITRALGMQDQVVVDLVSDDAKAGDLYLLCSDGLSSMLEDDEILGIVSDHTDATELCQTLIERANQSGGEDNITVLAIGILEEEIADAETMVPSTLTPSQAAQTVAITSPGEPAIRMVDESAPTERGDDAEQDLGDRDTPQDPDQVKDSTDGNGSAGDDPVVSTDPSPGADRGDGAAIEESAPSSTR